MHWHLLRFYLYAHGKKKKENAVYGLYKLLRSLKKLNKMNKICNNNFVIISICNILTYKNFLAIYFTHSCAFVLFKKND
ncbi:hypothetical protein C923_02132 [Plasmodium falciparum UGT5.1]|uniref:Uncharacterized protein n=3 Tax=Plasmodium falciparum TaxID=5833 RepID=W4IRH1_PLAFP|nr:hypothetical protein PFUGPA_05574 [Plasmodium falciparum Palo Alto/Uganda]ETW61887.1 hypothetical protein PFMC_01990 [Plasmodium falciparum CAMP/Malaysia]EWC77206.1 hypothetical protein C923_02132 [Plasmodium falciparum UGT5.1]